ncbi:MAG: IclR family transcriptional regulator [Neomegalonema sp.]|nr:IclR family transcriptional regulator [Neomegalonema sp.]
MPQDEGKSAEGLQSVILTMQILEAVAQTGKGVGVTSLAKTLGTSKSRIHRHLQTLVQQGYVFQHEDSERYEIGHRLIALGQQVFDHSGMIRASHDVLLELRDRLGHSAVASQWTPDGMLVVTTVSGRSPIEIGVRVGSLLPFHGSAQGKVACAFGTPAFQKRVLSGTLTSLTPATITDQSALRAELDAIRQRGWAVAPNQAAVGLNTLASPIFDGAGIVCGATAIVDLVQAIGEPPSAEQIAGVLDAARRISTLMGYSGRFPPC